MKIFIVFDPIDPPKIELDSDTFIGLEGQQVVIELKANGNPSNIVYAWTKNGLPIGSKTNSGQRIIAEDSKVIISSLSRNYAGSYFCNAINSQGTDVVEIKVVVQCR